MRYQPSLRTERLQLRPFVADDAPTVASLAGTEEMAAATTSIPHPYSLTAAKTWITSLPHLYRTGQAIHFAASSIETKELIGCFALKNIDSSNAHAEFECWIGDPSQGQGYATEAAREVLNFGFQKLKLHRIYSFHMTGEPKSSGFLNKLGLQHEGIIRQSIRKMDDYKDLALSAILAADHQSADQ